MTLITDPIGAEMTCRECQRFGITLCHLSLTNAVGELYDQVAKLKAERDQLKARWAAEHLEHCEPEIDGLDGAAHVECSICAEARAILKELGK